MNLAERLMVGVMGWMLAGGVLTVGGLALEVYGGPHGGKWDTLVSHLGFTLIGVGLVMGLLGVALFRARLLQDTYVMGYRHGRRDANLQLIEDDLWLTEKAAKKGA